VLCYNKLLCCGIVDFQKRFFMDNQGVGSSGNPKPQSSQNPPINEPYTKAKSCLFKEYKKLSTPASHADSAIEGLQSKLKGLATELSKTTVKTNEFSDITKTIGKRSIIETGNEENMREINRLSQEEFNELFAKTTEDMKNLGKAVLFESKNLETSLDPSLKGNKESIAGKDDPKSSAESEPQKLKSALKKKPDPEKTKADPEKTLEVIKGKVKFYKDEKDTYVPEDHPDRDVISSVVTYEREGIRDGRDGRFHSEGEAPSDLLVHSEESQLEKSDTGVRDELMGNLSMEDGKRNWGAISSFQGEKPPPMIVMAMQFPSAVTKSIVSDDGFLGKNGKKISDMVFKELKKPAGVNQTVEQKQASFLKGLSEQIQSDPELSQEDKDSMTAKLEALNKNRLFQNTFSYLFFSEINEKINNSLGMPEGLDKVTARLINQTLLEVVQEYKENTPKSFLSVDLKKGVVEVLVKKRFFGDDKNKGAFSEGLDKRIPGELKRQANDAINTRTSFVHEDARTEVIKEFKEFREEQEDVAKKYLESIVNHPSFSEILSNLP